MLLNFWQVFVYVIIHNKAVGQVIQDFVFGLARAVEADERNYHNSFSQPFIDTVRNM